MAGERGDDAEDLLLAYREREDGALVFERVLALTGESPEVKLDVDAAIGQALSRLRELRLEAAKETSRSRLLARREELGRLLADPATSVETLPEVRTELEQIQAALSARMAERGARVPARRGKGRRRR